MTNHQTGLSEYCDWNPKNLPTRKQGECENSEHEEWNGDSKHIEELHLCMLYSDFYNQVIETPKGNLTDDEIDNLWDEACSKKWKPNTERYWCKGCLESLE